MTLLGLLLLLLMLWGLAYGSAGAILWMLLPPILLISLQLAELMNPFGALPLWLIYATTLFFYLKPQLRRRWITRPLLTTFQKVMPSMSTTEQEALNAGSVWWDGELFSGQPDWSKLLRQPQCHLTAREEDFLQGPVQTLCDMLDDWHITYERRDLPPEVWQFIKQSGFFGMIIPQTYGGLGFSAYAHSQVVLKIASRSITAAVTVMVPNSLGPAKLLLQYGTDEQKINYLERLATGEEVPCFALTNPHAGSDAGAIPDIGQVTYGDFAGSQVLGIRLNWEKRYITLAPVATLIGLAFKLEDPQHLLSDNPQPGITLALIPRNTPGVEIGSRHMPLDIPFQNGPIEGRDVFIPLSWVIGGSDGVGKGWQMLMDSLSEGRGISLPALSTAAAMGASRYTGAYAAVRTQFGQPIGHFEGVEEALARIGGLTYQMDAARKLTLGALDSGETPSVISAIIKYHLTERYRQAINDAMDIQGGSGICLGPDNLIGRGYQAIPIAITVEGANILTRSMIIFGQGAIRAHPYILKEFEAAENPDPEIALTRFDEALFSHIGFVVTNLARTLWFGITHGRLSASPKSGACKPYFQRLNWMAASFALTADAALMTLGGSLKRKERLSARLGDLLSNLYIASACLKRYIEEGERQDDLPLMRWALDDSLYRFQHALRGLLRNMPFRPLAWLLRLVVFPTGLPFHKPTDSLDHQVARTLLSPSETRDRLTQGIYITEDQQQRAGQLEQALFAVNAAAPHEKTLRRAKRAGQLKSRDIRNLIAEAVSLGILSESEKVALEEADRLRRQVIQVNTFSHLGSLTSESSKATSKISKLNKRGVA
ncbi:acyl-CoA dehydrogenase [Candidatus Thiodiazotropha sp. CDECU1]|uniref:acyl-CoA dehydrogenase n=1 Tax=Candidatus Thiodiazotropha sp. CDECU1 TaxID=3065865 RepID=UPI00292EFFCA|nr:acyl-CoA dehydrogenase [Candidatus Thiodiazotropha sp. CDECU1]